MGARPIWRRADAGSGGAPGDRVDRAGVARGAKAESRGPPRGARADAGSHLVNSRWPHSFSLAAPTGVNVARIFSGTLRSDPRRGFAFLVGPQEAGQRGPAL